MFEGRYLFQTIILGNHVSFRVCISFPPIFWYFLCWKVALNASWLAEVQEFTNELRGIFRLHPEGSTGHCWTTHNWGESTLLGKLIKKCIFFGGIFRWNSQVEIKTRELFSLSPVKNTFLNTAQKVWDTLAFSIYISYDEDTKKSTNILKPKAISSISTSRTTTTSILCWSVILELYHLMRLSPIPYGIVTLFLGKFCWTVGGHHGNVK